MIIAIILLFVLCWGPQLTDNVLTSIGVLEELNYGYMKPLRQSFAIMAYSNSCINPIVYAFMSKNFRSSFLITLRSVFERLGCLKRQRARNMQLHTQVTQSSWRGDSMQYRTTTGYPITTQESNSSLSSSTPNTSAMSMGRITHKPDYKISCQRPIQMMKSKNGSSCCILETDDTQETLSDNDACTSLVNYRNQQVAVEI